MKQFKQLPVFPIKADKGSRVRKGIAAVFGNVDAWGDRIQPGAFQKTINEGSKRFRFLWNHDSLNPPIASIKEVKEVGRDELPPEVLEKSPEATGGLMVSREYYADVPLSKWVLTGVDKNDINEMSFAYDVIKSEETKEEIGDREIPINDLLELKLYDLSDVNWGMNSATVATGAKSTFHTLPLGALVSQFIELCKNQQEFIDTEKELIQTLLEKGIEIVGLPVAEQSFSLKWGEKEEPETPVIPSGDTDEEAEAAKRTSLNRLIELRTLEFDNVKQER